MSRNLYLDLAWLTPAPDSFTAQCRALTPDASDLGTTLKDLASHALDEKQCNLLSRTLSRLRKSGAELTGLTPLKIGLVSNSTTDFVLPGLAVACLRYGFDADFVTAPYGQVIQEALDPASTINRARPDLVLLALDYRGMPLRSALGDPDAEAKAVELAVSQMTSIRNGLRLHGGCVCIAQTLARPPESLFGNLDLAVPGTMRSLVDRFNRALADSLKDSGDLLFDVASLAENIGLGVWHDPVLWNLAKSPFANEAIPAYADQVGRMIGAWRGLSSRCLILDLDNTVWGGVIGDDGLEGIKISEGDAVGEAHLEVQRTALKLRDRGIVLAVSSKNTDEIARRPFNEHAEMLLKENHFAIFQANWQDKATNIKTIADALSLGIGSMAFLDDNPVERNLVRTILPTVRIPEVPQDAAFFARHLLASGAFEAVVFSEADAKRAEQYQDNAKRMALMDQAGDVESYLASLDMEIVFQPFDATGRTRIYQLINKSNQFNLTTKRYSEADVAAAEADPDCLTLQIRLIDAYGDNGMISVIVARKTDASSWDLDTWLMSCRVLGRRVEAAVLRQICGYARAAGISTLNGTYRPTDRNKLVENHYRDLGFDASGSEPDGTTYWTYPTDRDVAVTIPMRVVEKAG
jgi:FkbH-like protein